MRIPEGTSKRVQPTQPLTFSILTSHCGSLELFGSLLSGVLDVKQVVGKSEKGGL